MPSSRRKAADRGHNHKLCVAVRTAHVGTQGEHGVRVLAPASFFAAWNDHGSGSDSEAPRTWCYTALIASRYGAASSPPPLDSVAVD